MKSPSPSFADPLVDGNGGPQPSPGWSRLMPTELSAWQGSALGAAAGLSTWVASGGGIWAALAAVGLLAAGVLIDRRHAASRRKLQRATADYLAGAEGVGRDVVPVWSNHIETSRVQMESAISSLTERFAGIVDKLDQAMRASDVAGRSTKGEDK